MIYHEKFRFLDKFYNSSFFLILKQFSLLFIYAYMANFDSVNLIPRHVAVIYLKLKWDTSKVLRTALRIGFISNSLFISNSTLLFISFPSYNLITIIVVLFQAYIFVIAIITCSLEKHCKFNYCCLGTVYR